MNVVRQLSSRWGALAFALVVPVSVLVPGCKFESCADTNSCGSKDDDSMGGQGGAREMEDPDETSKGTGGGEMVDDGMGGDGAGENGTGGDEPVLTCDDAEVACDGECIDPSTDASFCGARGSCEGNRAGEVCDDTEICVDGACELDCPSGQVACDGSCVDPMTDELYCGTSSVCEELSECGALEQCISGVCAGWGDSGTVNFGTGSSTFARAGQVTIDGEGEVFLAWASPNASGVVDVQTSQFAAEQMIWGVPGERDTQDAPAGGIQMATNSSGRTVLVWVQERDTVAGVGVVWSAVREPGSDWSDAVALSGELAGGTSTLPIEGARLALDEDGNAYVVWNEFYSGNLVVNSLKAGESTWATPAALEIGGTAPFIIPNVRIESLADGEAVIVFERSESDVRTWYSAVSEGGVFGAVEPAFVATQTGDSLSPSLASNGEAAVLFWTENSGTPAQNGIISLYRDGAWTEPAQLETPDGPDDFSQPKVVIDAAGNITAAWISGSATDEIWSASLPAGADEWTFIDEPVAVDADAGSMSELLLAVDGFGNLQLAWVQNAELAQSVWGARRPIGETEFSNPRVLEDWYDIDVQGLSMDFNASGQGIVTWWTTVASERTLGFNYFH